MGTTLDTLLAGLYQHRQSWGCTLQEISSLVGRDVRATRSLLRDLEAQDILVGDYRGGSTEQYYLLTQEGETLAGRAMKRLARAGRRGPWRGPLRGSVGWMLIYGPIQELMRCLLACPEDCVLSRDDLLSSAGVRCKSLGNELVSLLVSQGWAARQIVLTPGVRASYVIPTPAGRVAMADLLRESHPVRTGALNNAKMARSDRSTL